MVHDFWISVYSLLRLSENRTNICTVRLTLKWAIRKISAMVFKVLIHLNFWPNVTGVS